MFLIAVVNGFNLLLARLEARAEEMAVRASLGASRGRLLRQILVESLILAFFAGGLAVGFVAAGVGALVRAAPPEVTLGATNAILVDERILGFAFLATVTAGLACALFPALMSLRWADAAAARGGRAHRTLSRNHARVRAVLVIGQVSLAMTLLMGAGLLLASFARLLAVDPGFDPERLALLSINPNEGAYVTAEQRAAFGVALEERLLALAGVEAVARADGLPPRGNVRIKPALQTAEDDEPRSDSPFLLPWATVGPEYLGVLGVPVVEGRNFTTADGPQSNVVIIDRDLAGFLWSGGNAVGRRFRMSESGPWLTVVGIVEELMLGLPDGSYGEHVVLRPAAHGHAGTYYAIRGRGAPEEMIGPIRDAVTALDSRQPIYELSTAHDAILDELQKQRFFMTVVGVLAAVALSLMAIGLYGLLNFLVQRRAREIGIRMALGARARTVLAGVLRGGLTLVAAGLVLGLAGTVVVGRFMQGIIFGVEPGHPGTLLGACALLCTVAVLACLVPARRATRVEPASVMKGE